MKWSRLKDISIFKTLYFNVHYFGVKSLSTVPVVVSKHVRLSSMNGSVQLNWQNVKMGSIRIGFPIVGIFYKKYERTIWDNSGIVEFKGPSFIGGG